jgi:hypothetical protein
MRRWMFEKMTEFLTRPLSTYERRGWNDPDAIRRHVRKGDVLLVEGDQRISALIRYVTQSSWSHAALYVGDELLRRDEHLRAETLACFGDEARHMVVEALIDGVVASPLSKYMHLNLRICRPHNLKPPDLKTILDDAVRSLGWRYDVRNVLDLLRYLLPAVRPSRYRRQAPFLGSGGRTDVICSSHLARLFHGVGFPIQPEVEFPDALAPEPPRRRGLFMRRRAQSAHHYRGVFRRRHPTLLTPRDFDLSPYFEVVKFNVLADRAFDYSRLQWIQEVVAEAAADAASAVEAGSAAAPAGPESEPPAGADGATG